MQVIANDSSHKKIDEAFNFNINLTDFKMRKSHEKNYEQSPLCATWKVEIKQTYKVPN